MMSYCSSCTLVVKLIITQEMGYIDVIHQTLKGKVQIFDSHSELQILLDAIVTSLEGVLL